MEHHRNSKLLVFLVAAISFFILGFFSSGLISPSNEIKDASKSTVMGYVSGGTMALGALSLTILAYSFSEIRSGKTSEQKAPYRRLALITYLIIPLSLTDSVVSILFILTEVSYSFEISLALLYIIVVMVIVSVTQWTFENL